MRRVWIFFFLCFCGLALPARAQQTADELLREFKKYFRQYKDTPTRVEAVLALKGTESVGVVETLLPILKQKDAEPEVVRACSKVLASFTTREPIDALLAVLAEDKSEPVQIAILQSIREAKYPSAAKAILPCLAHPAWEVRLRALQAVAASQDPDAAQVIATLAADKEPAVLCGALEALAALNSPLVVQPAIAALENPVWQVRASAIVAVRQMRPREAIAPLIQRLEVEDGRLKADIADTLESMTAIFDCGQDAKKWQAFWDDVKDTYRVPSPEAVAALRKRYKDALTQGPRTGNEVAETAAEAAAKAVNYQGIDTPSHAILFIIDVSGSMENLVVEKERFKDGNYPSFLRMDIVKTELARTIERLETSVQFNILSFATEVSTWKKTLVPANVLNKSSAAEWSMRLEAIGGSSKDDLATAGLVGSANLGAGKTNSYGALMSGLGAAGRAKTKDYAVEVDTIFFLSDGRPSCGDFVDPDDILREVREANELRKVVIHTIAIGEFQKDFMKTLAEQNQGTFVDLGR